MIPLTLLVGAALILAAGALGGRPAVIALAGVLALLSAASVLVDVVRARHDRGVAYRRWDTWQLARRRRGGR